MDKTMNMAIVDFGFRQIVLPLDKAVQVVNILVEGEVYEYKYHRDSKTEETHKTNHIFKTPDTSMEIRVITNEQYNNYKLAGAPAK